MNDSVKTSLFRKQTPARARLCLLSAAFLLLSAVPAQAATSKWNIEPDKSSINFMLRILPKFHKCEGSFSHVAGTVQYDPEAIENSSVKAVISISTIDTSLQPRNDHLKKKDYFDVDNFPAARFNSRKVIAGKGKDFQIVGDLYLHGLSNEVVLDATKTFESPDEMRVTAKTVLKRSDYKIGSGPKALTLTDSVDINIELHMTKAIVFKNALPQ